MTRAPLAFLATVIVLAGCSPAHEKVGPGDLPDVAVATALEPRRFTSRTDLGGLSMEVSGTVEDDYRYLVEVSFGGRPAYAELVRDDRRWVRFDQEALWDRLPSGGGDLAGCVGDDVDPAGVALAARSGDWIEDAGGAPSEVPSLSAPPASVAGPELALEQVRFLDRVPELVFGAGKLREWDPQAIDYVPSEDRFEPHADLGRRFDALPATYDENRLFRDGIPGPGEIEDAFRFVAIWVGEQDAIRRVEVLVDVPDLTEVVERVRRVEAERRGLPADAAPDVALPPSTSMRYEIEPGDVQVPAAPTAAPMVDLACLAEQDAAIPAPVVAEEVSP